MLSEEIPFSGGRFAGYRRRLEFAFLSGDADRTPPLWIVHVALGRDGAALAPLYQSAKKMMRRFEPFLIRRGITQQANISWTESD